jgi:hypothetical protein
MTYAERAASAQNAMAKSLLSLMESKQSNLSVAADLPTCAQVLALAGSLSLPLSLSLSLSLTHTHQRQPHPKR